MYHVASSDIALGRLAVVMIALSLLGSHHYKGQLNTTVPSSPRASMLPRKNVLVANVAAHPGGSPMPPARRCPSKGTRMPLPPMQRVPSPGTRPRLGSSRSPQALERACCLGNEPCLYRSYEGFTRCSRVLVRSHLRTSRGSTRDAVS